MIKRKWLGALMLGATVCAAPVAAQEYKNVKVPDQPLVLKARGSFYVGGRLVQQTQAELGGFGPDDQITVDQMYVEYMVPAKGNRVPVIMMHGATLSGKSYDTTPDGRMGWYEYFVRKGHPVFVPDQVGRARSGFDQKVINNVRAGVADKSALPGVLRLGDNLGVWTNFRFGPSPGVWFQGTQYPTEATGELSKQSIPDLSGYVPSPNPTFKALAELGKQVGGAVLMGHSQGGRYPTEAALVDASGLKALVLVEPGACNAPAGYTYTDEHIAKLAKLPILIMFGDNLQAKTGLPGPSWQDRYDDCERFMARIAAAGGKAELVHPPKLGIHGNTHMIMQDRNSLAMADLILKWVDKNVKK